MEWRRTGWTASPRRRRDARYAPGTLERSSSNSSTSSDILVAGPPKTPTTQHRNHYSDSLRPHAASPASTKATKVFIENARLTVRFGPAVARERFRAIVRAKPKPLSQASNSATIMNVKLEDDESEYDDDDDDDDDVDAPTEGPNHRGTYSKEYTLKHPEIGWVHRGQGRYLPAAEIKSDSPATSPRPTRQTIERATGSLAVSEQTMEKMTAALEQHFDDWRKKNNPNARDNWSPTFKHQFRQILDLIKTTPRQQWYKAADLIKSVDYRECTRKWIKAMDRQFPMNGTSEWDADEPSARTRHSRQFKPTNTHTIDPNRRSTRITDVSAYDEYDEAGDTDDSGSSDKTFRKDYVDAHPGEKFYHTGNGWYKRGSRSEDPDRYSARRDSNTSHAVKSSISDASHDLDPNATVHAEDLHKYVGKTFHHKGNGWYRPGMAPNGRRGSIRIAADGSTVPAKKGEDEDEDDEMDEAEDEELAQLEHGTTVDKAFTLRHPTVEWVHRGQGRYKRKSSVFGSFAGTATPAASSERRSSRADNIYAESHASEDLGLRRTSSRTIKRPSKASVEAHESEPTELFDRAYVEAHPNEQFYHRGQGRYARGTRPKPVEPDTYEYFKDEQLFDSHYVKSHPDETFHHRGQGKWARGLPPPGASNKMAVRGPGAINRADSSRVGEENEAGEQPPPLSALLRRDEGPDRWPHLNWIYRGGGKWCRQTKEESLRLANAHLSGSRKPGRPVGRPRRDGPEAQLQREARAAEVALKRKPGPGKMVHRRYQKAALFGEDSSNSHSKAPTPRPPLLPAEKDVVLDEDLPSLYKDEWSEDEDDRLDEAGLIMRKEYIPIIGPEVYVKALTKFDPAVRSLDTLKQLAANAQSALQQLQDEYLDLDVLVAQNPMPGKKDRRPVKGGRQALEHTMWEDKKEAMLYDYSFDPRKIGYQDPDAQRIVRDAEGRELRRRRGRIDPHHTAVDYGDGEMTNKRTVKPVSRFDGVIIPPPRKRSRLMLNADDTLSAAGDETPERTATPILDPNTYQPPARGRWKDHVPKRILELRGESVSSSVRNSDNNNNSNGTPKPATVRKGRPPGSKNLHKRKDAGIKKGPRKPKASAEPTASPSVEPEDDESIAGTETDLLPPATVQAIMDDPPDDMPAAAAPAEPMAIDEAVTEAPSLAAI